MELEYHYQMTRTVTDEGDHHQIREVHITDYGMVFFTEPVTLVGLTPDEIKSKITKITEDLIEYPEVLDIEETED